MTSELSIQERLQITDDIRSRINRAADLLSGYLGNITTEDTPENKENVQPIKREIRTILTQLARFSELSKKSTKNIITVVSFQGQLFTTYQSVLTFHEKKRLIELWASHALTLTTGIDITKWPFEIDAGIRARIGEWIDVHFKGKTERPP